MQNFEREIRIEPGVGELAEKAGVVIVQRKMFKVLVGHGSSTRP